VATFVGGGTPSKSRPEFFQGDIPWVSPKDMKGTEIFDSEDRITPQAIEASATRLIAPGAVLVVVRSGVLKHTLPVAINRVPVTINQDLKALRCSERLVPEYLLHFLRASAPRILQRVRGTTADNIPVDTLRALQLALPELDEQRSIAAVLGQADALRHKRLLSLDRLASLRQAVFVEMFGDPARNPRGWPVVTIGSLLKSASYGSSRRASSSGAYPMLRMNNITRTGELNLTDLKFVDLDASEQSKYLVEDGELLFNRTNSPELVGKTTVYRGPTRMAFAGYLVRLVTESPHSAEYLSALLNSGYGKRRLRGMCKSIIGMANINAREIQALAIPNPPLGLQAEFAQAVARLESSKTTVRGSLRLLDGLFNSLQHRIFGGEL